MFWTALKNRDTVVDIAATRGLLWFCGGLTLLLLGVDLTATSSVLYICYFWFNIQYSLNIFFLHRKNREKLHQEHFISFRVFFAKICHYYYCHYCYCHYSYHYYWHNLSFLVLSQFEFFLSFVTIWVFKFCHNFRFWVLSQFDFLSVVKIWVFRVLSQFEFLSFVTIWVF